MTNSDFDLILINSIKHYQTRRGFFEKAKSDNFSDEFVTGLINSFKRLKILFDSNSLEEINSEPIDFCGCVDGFSVNLHRLLIRVVIDGENQYFNIDSNDIKILEEDLNKYLQYITEKEKSIKNNEDPESDQDQLPDNSELLKELSAYISDIDPIDFSYLVAHKCLREGTKQAKWLKTPADAYRFIDHIGMDRPNFNLCFKLKNQPELSTNHRQINKQTGKPTRSAINKKLDKFLPK